MMNHVALTARIVSDAQILKQGGNGAPDFITLRVVSSRKFKAKGDQDYRQEDLFINVKMNASPNFRQYLTKGRMISISGALVQNNYTDKDGNKRTEFYIRAMQRDVELLSQASQDQAKSTAQAAARPAAPAAPATDQAGPEYFQDDDIPF